MPETMRNSMLNLSSAAISMVSGFVAAVIVARLLDAEGVGATAFGFWIASCTAAIADRGYPQSLLRNAAAEKDEASRQALVLSSFRGFASVIAFVFFGAVLLVIVTGSVSDRVDIGLWLATAILFLFYCLSSFAISASRGLGDFAGPARNTILGSLFYLPLSALGSIFMGPAGAILALATRYLPQAAGIFPLLRLYMGASQPLSKDFHLYRRQMWLNDMISILALSRLEYLFLLLLATKADMGHFAIAIAFAGLVEQLVLQLSSPLLVSFSGHLGEKRLQLTATHNAFLFIALIFLPVSIGGAAIAPVLVPFVYGEAFVVTGSAAAVMLLAGGISALSIVPWTFLAVTGHASILTRVMIISALITCLAAPAAILIDGTQALAWARVFSEAIILSILLYSSRRMENITPPFSLLVRIALSASLCGLAAFLVISISPTVFGLLLSILMGAVVYILALKLSNAVPRAALAPMLSALDMRQDKAVGRHLRKSLLWVSAA
ncbi:MAG: hypothetical protein RIR97_1782 [Pseudomonadota bacterium]